MLPLDRINLWILSPAIGFGAFLVITLILVVAKPRFRNRANLSFLFFSLSMLAATLALLLANIQAASHPSINIPFKQTFWIFGIFTFISSLIYYIFIETEVTGSFHWQRAVVISAGALALIAALLAAGVLDQFPVNRNLGMTGFFSAIFLLSGGTFSATAIFFYKHRYHKFPFFGIAPVLLLVGVVLNTLYLNSPQISALTIWGVYIGLTTCTLLEGIIEPTNTRIDQVQSLNLELVDAYKTTLEGWARALELRDKETVGHSRRVTQLAVDLGAALGLPEMELQDIRFGALLHDIGKMAIPDHILKKPGSLTNQERKIMIEHAQQGYDLIKEIKYLRSSAQIVLHHHEKWDGSGYPHGLAGENIPHLARLFAVVDVWDAITSNRPYADAWPVSKARTYIQEESGKSFDPQIVDVFLELIDQH
ncbi:MAG: HD-GYP domain-containing protein [Anaerolineales bacterium]|nr:HD-GYP domain-containing protein [Anaerolineales bacterium]